MLNPIARESAHAVLDILEDNDPDHFLAAVAAIEERLATNLIHHGLGEAMRDLIAKRLRQVSHHGFDAAHDDAHARFELGRAGLNYVVAACLMAVGEGRSYPAGPPLGLTSVTALAWPFEREWWRPDTQRDMLLTGAAFLVAQVDLLDRQRDGAAAAQGEAA